MPFMSPRFRPVGALARPEAKRDFDRQRRQAEPWRLWYGRKDWQRIRGHQLAIEPLCERHKQRGEIVAATVVNHVEPHRGDWAKFIDGPFESLCKPCHDGEVQAEERAAEAG